MSRDVSTPERIGEVRPVAESRADRLAAEAAEAAQVRSLTQHPDVIALRVEKVRAQVDALVWAGIVLGLGFTMVNVQHFAAAGAAAGSLPWLAAWLLDPMVSLVLVAVLRAEQVTARYQVPAAPWARRAKWFAFTATFTMNTWQSWAALDPAGIVLHSVPPVGVLCAAEAAPWLRDRLSEAVHAAARDAEPDSNTATTGGAAPPADTEQEPFAEATTAPAETAHEQGAGSVTTGPTNEEEPFAGTPATAAEPTRQVTPANTATATAGTGRKLLADYVAEARDALSEDTEITPAWVRQVTGCARSTSAKAAEQLRREQHATPTLTPVTNAPAAEHVREVA